MNSKKNLSVSPLVFHPNNVKTAEPIGPKFFITTYMTLLMVFSSEKIATVTIFENAPIKIEKPSKFENE